VRMKDGKRTDLDGDKVLERFRHLQTFDVEMTGMEEVVDPLLAIMVRLRRIKPNRVEPNQKGNVMISTVLANWCLSFSSSDQNMERGWKERRTSL
jgi:hypothetical protein